MRVCVWRVRVPGVVLRRLRDAFRLYDADGNGTIDLGELKAVMKRLGAPEGQAEQTMAAADTLHNGVITFDEFCAAVGPLYEHSHVALRRAFNVFDEDRNGFIDRTERTRRGHMPAIAMRARTCRRARPPLPARSTCMALRVHT